VSVVERYLLLGLRLGRHVHGFVDAYYGPPELAERVDAEPLADAAALAEDAAALVPDAPTAWLRAQIRGCETTARRLVGEKIGWADEIERCYGVTPAPTSEERFSEAHERLAVALPGDGTLAERYQGWLESRVVPGERLLEAALRFEEELRARTETLFGLPDGESAVIEAVTDEPWTAFNYYLGGRRSRVAINTDLPTYSFVVPDLVAHEIYPGHHTERSWKEALLVDGAGRLEESICLIGTPQALVSEGIAEVAPSIVLGAEIDDVAARVYADLGLPYEPETSRAVRAFRDAIDGLSVNAARLLHVEGRAESDAVDYVERWGLNTRNRAEASVGFLTHPTWRAYASCYVSGRQLCERFVGGDPARFRRLLTEQLTTSDLVPG
jgi:hypothetical protein